MVMYPIILLFHGSCFYIQLSDLAILEEVIRMVLEIINSCVTNTLHHNPNLVYTLLHRRELFAQFRTHPLFHDIIQNIDTVSGVSVPVSLTLSKADYKFGESKTAYLMLKLRMFSC